MLDLSSRSGLKFDRSSIGKGASLRAQNFENREEAERLGVTIVESITERVSAFKDGIPRPGYDKLLAMIPKYPGGVLILHEASRGDRRMEHWVPFLALCRTHGVLIHLTKSKRTYDTTVNADWLDLLNEGIDSERESRQMSERITRGVAQAAREGRPAGRTPFGYRRVYDPRTRKFLRQEIDSDPRFYFEGGFRSPEWIAKWIFSQLADGMPILRITKRLNTANIPTPVQLLASEVWSDEVRTFVDSEGREFEATAQERWAHIQWERGTLQGMANNEQYLGHRLRKGVRTATDCWPVLIKAEIFELARDRFRPRSARRLLQGRSTSSKYLLVGVLRCGKCGNGVETLKIHGRRIYRCSPYGHTSIPVIDADNAMSIWVVNYMANPGTEAALRAAMPDGAAAEAASTRVHEIQAQMDGLLNKAEMFTPELFDMKLNELKVEQDKQRGIARSATLHPMLEEMLGPDAERKWAERDDMDWRRRLIALCARVSMKSVGPGKRQLKGIDRLTVEPR